jgi:hypothetical protein
MALPLADRSRHDAQATEAGIDLCQARDLPLIPESLADLSGIGIWLGQNIIKSIM